MTGSEALGVVRNGLHVVLREGDGGGSTHAVEVEPRVAWLEDDGSCVAVDLEVAAVVRH